MTIEKRAGAGAIRPAMVRDGEGSSDDRAVRFEMLLGSIANRFVQAPVGGIAQALGEALAGITQFMGFERSHVYLFDRDRELMNEIARWPRGFDNEDALFSSIPRGDLPYFADQVFALRTMVMPSVDSLPESATADRAFLEKAGMRSGVTQPMQALDGTIGTLTLTMLGRERSCDEVDLALIRRAADVLAPALMRYRAEAEHIESLRFERLMTSLLAEFVNLPVDELAGGIERALETIARSVDCDRAVLFVLDPSADQATIYRAWWAADVLPSVTRPIRVDTGPDTPYGKWVASETPYLILTAAEIERISPAAVAEIRRSRLGTTANFPLEVEGRRLGWFGIGAKLPRVGWSVAEIKSLGLAANALANMYARGVAAEERRRLQNFEDTLSQLAVEFIKRPPEQMRLGVEELIDGLGSFARCERAAVMRFDEADATASTYHEWAARQEPARIRGFPFREAPWFLQQVMTQRGPWFVHVEDVPPSDRLVAETLSQIGIGTLLTCSINDGDVVFGYACVGYRRSRHRPPPGTEQVLAMTSGIIANALARDRLEAQAAQQRDALARAQRLNSLGQLAAAMAHDLGQPLTAIINFSHTCSMLLENQQFDRAEVNRMLNRISAEAKRSGRLIHSLREHVAGQPRRPGAVSLAEILNDVFSVLEGAARTLRVKIDSELPASLPLVRVDPVEVGQILINVVQNGIESIAAADVELREIRIRAWRERALVAIEIADSGPGFVESEPGRAFEQFYSTKPGGLGLGLSVSRALAVANNATLEFVPVEIGACVRLTLPAVPRRRDSAARVTAARKRINRGVLRRSRGSDR